MRKLVNQLTSLVVLCGIPSYVRRLPTKTSWLTEILPSGMSTVLRHSVHLRLQLRGVVHLIASTASVCLVADTQ